jgi:tetratricopeptide (TPR) repeat protein
MTTLLSRPSAIRRRRWRLLAFAVLSLVIAAGLYPLGRYFWADSHYQAALAAADRRDFDAARAHFDVCMREWPESAEVRFQAARSARRAGDLDSAARLLHDAKRLGWVPEAIELEQALTELRLHGHQGLAGPLLELVRRGHPDSVLILEALTPSVLAALEMDFIMQCLDLWLERAPNDERPYLLKGDILERLSIRVNAINLYRDAVRLAPENTEARRKLGWLALGMKLTGEAAEQFDWLIARQPDSPELRRGLAKVRQAQGRSYDAQLILDALLAERPDDALALGDRGALEMEAGDSKSAEKWLKPAVAGAPSELHLLNQWELCLRQQGRDKEANEVRKRIDRGEADEKRLAELRRDLMRKPRDPAIRLEIGQILMRNGLEREGLRWLETGLAQEPRHIATHQALADYFTAHGDKERAEQHRRFIREIQQAKN